MWESSTSEVSICYMCVCMLVLVTSYICKGDGSIEEVKQPKLGVAYCLVLKKWSGQATPAPLLPAALICTVHTNNNVSDPGL